MAERRTTFAVLDPATMDTLRRAEMLYRGIAEGRLKIYDQESWDWMKPSAATTNSHADRLATLREQLKR